MKISSGTRLLCGWRRGVVGWAASGVFAGLLHWGRSRFVVGYSAVVLAFAALRLRAADVTHINRAAQQRRLIWHLRWCGRAPGNHEAG